jgi:hypothetical protein
VLDWLRQPGGVKQLPEEARVQLEVGLCNMLGQVEALRTDGSVHEMLDMLEHSPTSGARQTAAAVRLTYYAHRGERGRFSKAQDEVDVLASQAGTTWRHDLLAQRMFWSTYALCEDVMGLKRVAGELERSAAELPSLEQVRDAARACYLTERHRPAEALARHEASLAAASADNGAASLRFAVAYAHILRAAGRAEQARTLCRSKRASMEARDQDFMFSVCLSIEELLASAELGETQAAALALDELIMAQAQHDSPLLHGLAHKARAQVALLQRDRVVFVEQLRAMHGWFLRTDNPALMGQYQRLSEDGRAAGVLDDPRSQAPHHALARNLAQVSAALSACRGRGERLETAMELILDHSAARRGYLYVLEADGLRFAAPTIGIEPPEALRAELMSQLHGMQSAQRASSRADLGGWLESSTTVMSPASTHSVMHSNVEYETQFLLVRQGDDLVVVGAVALQKSDAMHTVEFAFLEEVARGIYSAGDVHTVFTNANEPSTLSRTVRHSKRQTEA